MRGVLAPRGTQVGATTAASAEADASIASGVALTYEAA
jgi:hypothetical protein